MGYVYDVIDGDFLDLWGRWGLEGNGEDWVRRV